MALPINHPVVHWDRAPHLRFSPRKFISSSPLMEEVARRAGGVDSPLALRLTPDRAPHPGRVPRLDPPRGRISKQKMPGSRFDCFAPLLRSRGEERGEGRKRRAKQRL